MRQGCAAARVSQFRPYFVGDIRKAIKEAESDSSCAGKLLTALRARFPADTAPRDTSRSRLSFGAAGTLQGTGLKNGTFYPLWEDVRPTSEGEPAVVGIGRIRLTYDGGPHVLLVTEAFGETDVRNDPSHPRVALPQHVGRRRISGRVHQRRGGEAHRLARARARSVARRRRGVAGALRERPGVRSSACLRSASRNSSCAHLPRRSTMSCSTRRAMCSPPASRSSAGIASRSVTASTYRPTKKIELTLGETAVVQRQGFTVDLAYLNPLMIYQTTQHDTSQSGAGDANLTGFFAARATAGRATFSGEFLVDDIQIDSKDRANYPNQLGWNVEAAYALPIIYVSSLGVQYRRIDSFTYIGQVDYSKVYQNFDAPLGSELGPDADMVRGYGEFWASGKLRFVGGIARWRHGAYRITDRPTLNRLGHANDPYPDTTVDRPDPQRAWIGDLSAEWLDGIIPITAKLEVARITNVNNVPTPAKNLARLQVIASYRFRYP